MVIIGIDPGLSGALAELDTETGQLIRVHDMPKQEYRLQDGRKRARLDAVELWDIILKSNAKLALIEEVNSHNMGRQSAFNFGATAGVTRAMVDLAAIPVIMLPPNMWKPRMGLKPQANPKTVKEAARTLASALEGTDRAWPLKKHDGRAEAYLIAQYGMRMLAGEITP